MMRREFDQQTRNRIQQDRLATMAQGGTVVSVNPRTNTLKWGGVRGRQEAPITHPYLGPTSWFRVCPERSTKVVAAYRGENLTSYVAAYVAESIDGKGAETLIEATEAGKFYYRVLKEGEMHAVSTGLAEVTWLQNGNLVLRGGSVRVTLDNESLEAEVASPTYRNATLGSRAQQYGNESRFGVATRPSPLDTTQRIAIKHNDTWVKEYTRHLNDGQTTTVDHREGVVIEDNGTVAEVNGAALRLRSKYGTVQGDYVSVQVDENGNTVIRIPQCDDGLTVETLTKFGITVGETFTVVVNDDWLVQADNIDFDANTIQLAGSSKLLTEAWGSTLSGADALVPATTPADAVGAVNAVIAYLKLLNSAFQPSLTTKTGAG